MLAHAHLICVNANGNNNKFYDITLNNDNSIDVEYGRIGGNVSKHHYENYEKT